ncbi:MAG: redoxin domain-containing protein [Prolixibacteraceae bacterium]|nr:redoxin domain-containing protein [Prolixibacteraceae bacterium]
MRRIVKYLIIVIIGFTVGFLIVHIINRYGEKKEAETRIQSLPCVSFNSISGIPVNLHEFDQTKPLIIIYFHPECEHCRYEAREIGQNAPAFHHFQLVMVAPDDSLQRVEKFCSETHLWELENLEILLDTENQFKKVFGNAVIPSVYIYATNRKLIKIFFGETKPQAIINATKNSLTSN